MDTEQAVSIALGPAVVKDDVTGEIVRAEQPTQPGYSGESKKKLLRI